MTDRQPPRGYDPPHAGVRTKYVHFYLKPQPDHDGPTPLFMVMRLDAEGERPLAERCLARDGIAIVDALRLDYGIATWGVG
jgi:hypothetical protein